MVDSLVADCLADIASGQAGFFYVRECFDGINSGWNPVPIVLPGIVWSIFAQAQSNQGDFMDRHNLSYPVLQAVCHRAATSAAKSIADDFGTNCDIFIVEYLARKIESMMFKQGVIRMEDNWRQSIND